MNYSLELFTSLCSALTGYEIKLKTSTIKTKRAFDDFQIDQHLLQSTTRKTRIDSWKNQEYSTEVDRVRKPMHQCMGDETLREGIFLIFGQT